MEERLERIEARLNAISALMVERHIRELGGPDRRRARSPEQMLRDVGLSTGESASILGKSDPMVRKALEG
jgi:hypothetical protein